MSQFSWPGKRRHVVMPLQAMLTKWFRSPYVGVVSSSVRDLRARDHRVRRHDAIRILLTNLRDEQCAHS